MMAYLLHSVELVFTGAELENLLNASQIQVLWGSGAVCVGLESLTAEMT
jgi:hypothetical protein